MREAIFDTLQARNADMSRVLDLYAGSGALGIEALSRGADWCDFVESSAASAAVIDENVHLIGLETRGRVHKMTVERAAKRLQGPYTLVLADPPYEDEAAARALEHIAAAGLVGPETTLVLEHSRRRTPLQELGPLQMTWSRRYGDTQVSIYGVATASRPEDEEGTS